MVPTPVILPSIGYAAPTTEPVRPWSPWPVTVFSGLAAAAFVYGTVVVIPGIRRPPAARPGDR